MKKRWSALAGLVPALALSLALFACGTTGFRVTNKDTDKGFVSADGALSVKNFTTWNFALFVGRPEKGLFLGMVLNYSSANFELSKIPGLPQKGSFILRAVPMETYTPDQTVPDDQVLFSGLVSYDLGDPEMKMTVNIPAEINTEGEFAVSLSNNSPFIVEIRLDSPDGTAIAALAPFEKNKRVYIKPDAADHRLFPVYVDGQGRRIIENSMRSGTQFTPVSAGRNVTVLEFSGPPDGGDSLSRDFQLFNE
jgi:hypothetical protein